MDDISFSTAHFIDPEPVHNHIKQYVTLGFSLGAVIILLLVLGGMFYTPTRQKTANQPRGVIPLLIKDKQDLNNALKAYDNSSVDTTVKAGLNQNSQDVSRFSQ